ncbi:MAG TPA: hypothetical protein VFT12_14610 [Thermoanaerobaculia bacterium]|nr:hypothetical protein [Thermoanaerobaculia bacterium]
MSRRVRNVVAALFALSLVLQTPVASAAPRERDRSFSPSFIQRVVKVVKGVLKPLGVAINDDDAFSPTPPKP